MTVAMIMTMSITSKSMVEMKTENSVSTQGAAGHVVVTGAAAALQGKRKKSTETRLIVMLQRCQGGVHLCESQFISHVSCFLQVKKKIKRSSWMFLWFMVQKKEQRTIRTIKLLLEMTQLLRKPC